MTKEGVRISRSLKKLLPSMFVGIVDFEEGDCMKNIAYEQDSTNAVPYEVTDDSPALLCTVRDHMELLAVEALLRSYNIPVLKKWHDAGDVAMVYMATSFLGADVFVPSKLLEIAKELLEAEPC